MAGNYPDATSWRMAIDRDGTQIVSIDSSNNLTSLTSTDLRNLNDEKGTATTPIKQGGKLALVFPELRDIDAMYMAGADYSNSPSFTGYEVSADTTNGFDGTWTSIGTGGYFLGSVPKPDYRTKVVNSTALAVRAVRAKASTNQYGNNVELLTWHVYGEPAPGQNPNRLELWHPTLDEKLPPAFLDWGDVPRSSSADKQFRVKNLSTQQTANSVRVAMEILTDSAAPSVVSQHTLSYGGGSFVAQVNLGSLAPGAISGPVTLRRITPSNAVLSLWSFRVFAESTDWQ
jgi:hypothetical protein